MAEYSSRWEIKFNGYGSDTAHAGNSTAGWDFGNNPPALVVNRGSDTVTYTKLPTVGHYQDTITISKAGAATIDFTTAIDRVVSTTLPTPPLTITQAVFAIKDPDGVKCIRMGQGNDTDACSFGIAHGTNPEKAYSDRYHSFAYADPYVGTAGKKVIISNPSNTDLEIYANIVFADG